MRTLIAAIAICLTLTACSDDDPPGSQGYPTPTGDPTPTDEPSEPETVDPAEETAQEFLRRWVAVGNDAQNTGDVTEYAELSGPSCSSCDQFIQSVRDVYDAGGFIESDGEQVRRIEHIGGRDWRVSVKVAPTRYRERADGPTKTLPAGAFDYRVALRKSTTGWWVALYAVIEQ